MTTPRPRPNVYAISAHGGFADALAKGLLDRFGKDPLTLARGLVLLPNNRAIAAVQEAFVRQTGKGLLLPRLLAIGDPLLEEEAGSWFAAAEQHLLPAVAPLERRFWLMQRIQAQMAAQQRAVTLPQAYALAQQFGAALDQLLIEERSLDDLLSLDIAPELAQHWERSLALFGSIMREWQARLAHIGKHDMAQRRNQLFDAVGTRLRAAPPPHFICAAAINSPAPAIARLLRTIADLPRGLVLFANLDRDSIPQADWDWLLDPSPGPDDRMRVKGTATGRETHPQHHLALMLERMHVARAEVLRWNRIGESGAAAQRSRVLSHAFAPPERTAEWFELAAKDRSMRGIQLAEAAHSAQEAQLVALTVRQALAEPGKRVAIVTADRDTGRRVSAHLQRWNIQLDNSAGETLDDSPAGICLLMLLQAIAKNFAPAPLLALLKHPLVMPDSERLTWLEQCRELDRTLRGPRPAPGLTAIAQHLEAAKADPALRTWWQQFVEPLAQHLPGPKERTLPVLLDRWSSLLDWLTGGAIWRGEAGRALSALLTDVRMAGEGITLAPEEQGQFMRRILAEVAVRRPYGGHPRVALYGLLESRLQTADLVICCGLNEGSWPQAAQPDPWLAPMVRRRLGLPTPDRQVGLSAHDLMTAMGAREVLLTRALRSAGGPTIASRFLLRLQALCGDSLTVAKPLLALSAALDRRLPSCQIGSPSPNPPLALRPKQISVTKVDQLLANPFAYYAEQILGLRSWDRLDASPEAAWRGSAIHLLLEQWAREDGFDPAALLRRTQIFMAQPAIHPAIRALWAPRLCSALTWVAEQVQANREAGRVPILWEEKGQAELAGIRLNGRIDRLDRDHDGRFIIVDYKSGAPPKRKQVATGYALQLGLLGWLVEAGGFAGVAGNAAGYEYWSLAREKSDSGFGHVQTSDAGKSKYSIAPEDMAVRAEQEFRDRAVPYLTGAKPFAAHILSEYAFTDYDHLSRFEEWFGRPQAFVAGADDGA